MTQTNRNTENQLEIMVLVSFKGVCPPPSREEIEERAMKLAAALGVNDAELNEIVKSVQSKLVHSMEEGVSLVDQKEKHNENWHQERTDIKWHYWHDYDAYLSGQGWSPKIIHAMGGVTDKILGLLKNPSDPGGWGRKGLVVGHVQSGKTANYIGLISKAADAGYKFIIVIAGIHNNLRKQTQERIDEGFIGRQSRTRDIIGVGEINRTRAFPITLTNTVSDFLKSTASAFTADLKGFNRPVVVVIKKHVGTLANLHSWLKDLNITEAGGQITDIPMLMIDDEADHASINTNKPELDPTRTNEEIRKILKLFRKTCYVGYTATPFANIFINPESDEDMLGDDLFPRDFIYCLDPPSNYFGAQKVFIDEEISNKVLRRIDDAEEDGRIPLNHKKYHEVNMPQSLKEAISVFILSRAIRISRKQESQHCTMMVNVSRFVDIQRQIKEQISYYVDTLRRAIKYHYAQPDEICLRNEQMHRLKEIFDKEFGDAGISWTDVKKSLYNASDKLKVFLVNSKSDEVLDYKEYETDGEALTALSVGGLSLSRGLTLEGLTTSYIYRNTKMYDTLMQMGRWFGYRSDYEDLCRIYLSEESQGWYAHIAEATEELRQQVKQMRRDGLSPRDFGLYVRAHPDTLYVTALNKMRHAQKRVFRVSFDGRLGESFVVPSEETIRTQNLELMVDLYSRLKKEFGAPVQSEGSEVWKDIRYDLVLDFMERFRFHRELQGMKDSFLRYAREISDKYPRWDLGFISLVNSEPAVSDLPMAVQERQIGRDNSSDIKKPTEEDGWYVGNKQRLSGQGVEKIGLDREQLELARRIAEENGRKKPTDRDYRHKDVRGKPLLMLHLLRLVNKKKDATETVADNMPAVGFSFPSAGDFRTVEYVVNRVWIERDMDDSPDEEDDYDYDYERRE